MKSHLQNYFRLLTSCEDIFHLTMRCPLIFMAFKTTHISLSFIYIYVIYPSQKAGWGGIPIHRSWWSKWSSRNVKSSSCELPLPAATLTLQQPQDQTEKLSETFEP